jgi:hypothetical protein
LSIWILPVCDVLIAIIILFGWVGVWLVAGTIIPQGESPEYYFQNYTDEKPSARIPNMAMGSRVKL